MPRQDQFFRYLSIIRLLRRNGTATFSQIRSFVAEEASGEERSGKLMIRTFQRDLEAIRSLYRIDIGYDFSGRCYRILSDDHSDLNNRLIESAETLHTLRMAGKLEEYLFFEKRKAAGTHHLQGLLMAIRTRTIIELRHQKYDDDAPTVRTLQPYALRESRGRWYLVAREKGDGRIKTFGLDRILGFQNTAGRFDYPEGFSVNEHYRHCFGVIKPDNEQPVEILLSFDAEQGKYIKSYPLHESQEVIADNGEELRIRLKLYLTYDLVQEIMSYGDRVRVIQPGMLQAMIRQMARKMSGH